MPRECPLARAGRWLGYNGVSAIVHQPVLLRRMAALAQRLPWLAALAGAVVRRDDVVAAFDRDELFSNTAHRPNLVAGEFLIGLESGTLQDEQRKALIARLPAPAVFAQRAAAQARARVAALRGGPVRRFDLVTDYMAPIVWDCLAECFGGALPSLPDGDPLFAQLRHVGAHLIVGSIATDAAQVRARASAAALDAWVRAQLPAIARAWQVPEAASRDAIARDAVGLLWVGHPASVQALALIVLDLLPRRQWRRLAEKARAAGDDPWADPGLRDEVRAHVLESLRFRPPFPILRRDVVRDGHLGATPPRRVRGGSGLTLLGLGAMFDPAAMRERASAPRYDPSRGWKDPEDRWLPFGHGKRRCIAREQVVEMLASALIGLLLLPRLRPADPWWARFRLDGPAMARLRLRFD